MLMRTLHQMDLIEALLFQITCSLLKAYARFGIEEEKSEAAHVFET